MDIVTRNAGGRSRERGAVAVEFALIMPVLLLILTGVLTFGAVWSQYQTFQGAVRDGARCAATAASTPCDIAQQIRNATPYSPAFGTTGLSVTVGGAARPTGCLETDRGQDVTVSWVQPLEVNVAFWKAFTWNANIQGVFRCE